MASTESSNDMLAMLRESAADFVAGSTDFKALRARRGKLPGFDPGLAMQMAELGWGGILVPEAHGGLGLGFAEMGCVLQALGKGLIADPLGPSVLAARVLVHAGNDALAGPLLRGLAEGSLLPCVAWQEGLGGIDVAAIDTRADAAAGGGWTLSGRKRFVAGAAGACGFVVSARVGADVGLFWVDADARGLAVTHEWRADDTPSGIVALDGVAVSADAVLCAPGPRAAEALARAVDEAAVMASAELLGVMEAALAMALGYMRTRVQFGKPIGSFQALQHKATDLYVQQELARAVLDDAIATLDRGSDGSEGSEGGEGSDHRRESRLLASRCKARCSDAGMRIGREVIQLHGAIGFTDEYDAGLFLKRAMVLSGSLGNASAHRRRFGALMREAAAPV